MSGIMGERKEAKMYYSHRCSYCSKVFFTEVQNKSQAAEVLYRGIKQHLKEYGEDHKEYEFDEDSSIEVNQMYSAMEESEERPAGGYEL